MENMESDYKYGWIYLKKMNLGTSPNYIKWIFIRLDSLNPFMFTFSLPVVSFSSFYYISWFFLFYYSLMFSSGLPRFKLLIESKWKRNSQFNPKIVTFEI